MSGFDFIFFLTGMRESVLHLPVTLYVALAIMCIGIVLGFLVALARFYRVKFLSTFLRIAVTVLRGVPVILIILIIQVFSALNYDKIMAFLGLSLTYRGLNKALIAIAAISIPTIISMSEIFRGSFAAVDKNQFDASASIGHGRIQTLFRVIIPQMIPVTVPMTGNVVIATVKSTSLLLYLSVVDALNAPVLAAGINYRYLEAYLAAACVFWTMCASLEWIFHILEGKLKLQGAVT
ncbi:MAG: ABC transporter permease subunit [Treponema sp.]|jgi:L-cystine transport system permease protein|nr:ABC transporter permease subunit [Treponema sp.]